MKRKYRAVLGLILAGGVCLSGCSKPGGEASAAQKLGGSFTTEMTMQMETVRGALPLQSHPRSPGWCWTFPAGK